MKMLGVTVANTLSVVDHVRDIIHGCALRVLRSHGLNDANDRAVIVARLTYATSAWWGLTISDYRQRIEGLLRRGIRSGYKDADDVLFRRVLNNQYHLLHSLLPDKNSHGYDL